MFFHGDRNKNKIALTFDDGPSEITANVLDILKTYNIKATFFVVGKMIKGREQTLKRAQEEGHEFGNHTHSHKRLWFKSKKFIEQDILTCDEELAKLGIKTKLIRFPGLKYGPNALYICKKLGKIIIFADIFSWKQTSYDWFNSWLRKWNILRDPINITTVIERTISGTKNGSILAFHDYLQEIGPHREILPILEKILPELQKRGFEFVTVSELIS